MPADERDAPSVGPYRLLRLIGRGAVGEVHAALDARDGRQVALKLVPLGRAGDRDADERRRRFLAEAALTRRLVHPHIVAVHAAGIESDRGWIAMELLAGCDLERYTAAARLLPEPEVLRIGACVALALAHAHAHGVLHRDVKPGNVIVDWPTRRVTLTDFGAARLADAESTRTGVIVGTPDYMAPEQLAGRPCDARTDLYALGVVLYQLLSGRLPHDAPTMGELLRRVATEPAPDLRALRPELPPALAGLVAELLERDPERRPASAAAVAERLAALGAASASAPR